MSGLSRKTGESQLSFAKRITLNKNELDIDYSEWGKLVCGKDYSSDNARKAFYILKPFLEMVDEECVDNIKDKNMLDEIKDIIGELDIKKQEVKNKTNQLNKLKRNFIKSIEISNDLKEEIHNEIENFPQFEYETIISNNNHKLVVSIADWHIGYVIKNYKGNSYNYEIANKRLGVLLSEIIKVCGLYDITDVVVVNCGDSIENTGMRINQSYECEFDLSTQIVKATQLIFSFITDISKFANVTYYSVGGNHNRMSGLKDANLEGDNSNVIITEMLKSFVELSNNKRITVGDTDYKDDSCIFEVNNLLIKAIHGDNRPRDSKRLFDGESTMDDCKFDIILRGHDHNFNVVSQNNGGYVITTGCLFGFNPYSVKKMSCTTNASQTLILVSDKVEFIKDVKLQIN